MSDQLTWLQGIEESIFGALEAFVPWINLVLIVTAVIAILFEVVASLYLVKTVQWKTVGLFIVSVWILTYVFDAVVTPPPYDATYVRPAFWFIYAGFAHRSVTNVANLVTLMRHLTQRKTEGAKHE